MRGAWVEIPQSHIFFTDHRSRSPCGERGLKSRRIPTVGECVVSLPVRGAWVEMACA